MHPGLPDIIACKYPCHQEIFEIVQKWLDKKDREVPPNVVVAGAYSPLVKGYSGETGVANA
jgi:hypothetical protein